MKNPVAQLASKVWEAIKPPKPDLGYFMPDEQSDAIRNWRTVSPHPLHALTLQHVASSVVLLDPNELDASVQPRERDMPRVRDTSESAKPERAPEAAAERVAAE